MLLLEWIGRGVIALVAVAAIGASQLWLPEAPIDANRPTAVPQPELVKLASFGFDSLASDYYWVRAIEIVGSLDGARGRNRELAGLLELVTQLNPWVDHPYRFAAVWLIDDEQAVRSANRMLERGIERHPDEWRNRFYLGFNHFFYLDEPTEAAEAIEPAIDLPHAPRYLRRLVARLKSQSGGLDSAETFLRELARQAPNEKIKEEYLQSLLEIAVERRARMLDAARAAYVERHGRDIVSVEELLQRPDPIMRGLPADPAGGHWEINPYSGRIVSSKIGHRYAAKIDGTNRQLLGEFRERSQATESGSDSRESKAEES